MDFHYEEQEVKHNPDSGTPCKTKMKTECSHLQTNCVYWNTLLQSIVHVVTSFI